MPTHNFSKAFLLHRIKQSTATLENILTLFFKWLCQCKSVTLPIGLLSYCWWLHYEWLFTNKNPKQNPENCNATFFYFPNLFQRGKQRDGIDPTPSLPASLLALLSIVTVGVTQPLSLSGEQGIKEAPALPRGTAWRLLLHTPVHRGSTCSVSCGSPGTLDLRLTSLGQRLALVIRCTDFLSGVTCACGPGCHQTWLH